MKLALVIFLLSALATRAAALINAASPSRDDVVTAISSAADGDVVYVPAGSANWTNSVAITKAIKLIGAGIGQTFIYDWITNTTDNQALMNWTTTSNQPPARLSGFSFRGGRASNPITGAIYWNGTQKAYRMDHCDFVGVKNHTLKTGTWALGVIDNCTINSYFPFTFTSSTWADKTLGDGSWASPDEWGSTNKLYVENCTGWPFESAFTPWTDGYNGTRFCVRYCSLTNMWIDSHGTESSGRFRGTKSQEIYGNSFTGQGTIVGVDIRSGTAVIFSNSFVNFGAFCTLYAYRAVEAVPTWGGANGTNGFDTNSPTIYLTGAHNGTNGSLILVDTNASWTTDQWKGYIAVNTTSSAADTNSFGCVKNNDGTTMTFAPAPHSNHNNYWTNGNSYELRWVIQSLDQPGSGTGNLVVGDQPPGVWPNQIIDPIYQWGNTFSGFVGTNIVTPHSFILEGVHYTNGVARPGYTPLVYPHPLNRTNSITPASATIAASATQDFDSTGGSGVALTFVVMSDTSGGAGINGSTGLLTAGPNAGSVSVRAWDTDGSYGDAIVTVTGGAPAATGTPARLRRILQ